jgi:hypothetical protein
LLHTLKEKQHKPPHTALSTSLVYNSANAIKLADGICAVPFLRYEIIAKDLMEAGKGFIIGLYKASKNIARKPTLDLEIAGVSSEFRHVLALDCVVSMIMIYSTVYYKTSLLSTENT